ncbi:unnamed protein product [Arabidopsis lyrata]|nr:unnamed protein product [Arabidopsis lyrata]
MVETCGQHIKRRRTETQPLKLSRAERWNVVDEEDVFMDILSRVSVKSIWSLKTLSKHWHGSISTTYFCKLQLAHSRKNPSFIVCPTLETSMKLYSMDSRSFELSPLNTIDPSERSHGVSLYMISSFNGLICCVNVIFDEDVESKFFDLQIWICNPCTGETLLLPQGRPSFECEPCVGVAYSSNTSDYRIFRIFCTGKKIPEERESVEGYYVREGYAYECEMFSSSTGSWKNIGLVPCVPMDCGLRPYKTGHICVEGKVYWLVSLDEPGKILSVNLEGRFKVINLPEYEANQKGEDKITEGTHLINLKGSLALLVLHPGSMDIWLLKDNGETYSWVPVPLLKYHIRIKDDELVLTVTSLKNKIICVTETHWHIYNVDTGKWKKIRGPRTGFGYPAVFPFTESILPCKGGVKL